MQVILTEPVDNLGLIGETVTVKPGYARNFLLPRGKALRATKSNVARFEAQRSAIEAENAKKKADAEKQTSKFKDVTVTLVRQAPESGKLYGSVSARDIAAAVTDATGVAVKRQQIVLMDAYRMLGLFPASITLHPEVKVNVTLNIARSEEEAEIQLERGYALIAGAEEAAKAQATEADAVEAEINAPEVAPEQSDAEQADSSEDAKDKKEA